MASYCGRRIINNAIINIAPQRWTTNSNIMNKLLICLALLLTTSLYSHAQRFAYINTEAILDQLPEYQEVKQQLDRTMEQWQQDINKQMAAVEEMDRAYQAEKILLTEDLQKKREQEIGAKRKEVADEQSKRFGYEGDFFQKRQELIKPIQDQIYEAIEKLASQKGFDFIFDKSAGVNILYADEKFDKTTEVLRLLGVK